MVFSDKYPGEDEFVGFNLLPRLATDETITSVTFAVAVVAGTDAAAASMLQGSPIIAGPIVKHLLVDGVAGVHYRITATAVTSAGQTLIEYASLVVRAPG